MFMILSSINEEDVTSWPNVPFVSVCTPTFNRRPFIKTMLACFEHQTYPKERIEWIIIDDGTDKISDMVKDHPNIRYFAYEEKMTLGMKRNLIHLKSRGEILVYMDDDDYYPPERIQHAVFKLITSESALCGGSSEIYIYFKHIHKMYQFGPYGKQHATAGTFAFKRALLEQTQYDDKACIAEETVFLKNYSIPFVQFDPIKTILVFSHIHNTFDKKNLLEQSPSIFVSISTKTVDTFIKQTSKSNEIKKFFMEEIDSLLEKYEPGDSCYKPDVLEQIAEIETSRSNELKSLNSIRQQSMMIQEGDSPPKNMSQTEIISLLKKQRKIILHQISIIKGKDIELQILRDELSIMKQRGI